MMKAVSAWRLRGGPAVMARRFEVAVPSVV
jgi:hypothetical protein